MPLMHKGLEADLEKAKDGRWIMLLSDGSDSGAFGAPAAIARWSDGIMPGGAWINDGGFVRICPVGFVELSDLGLVNDGLFRDHQP